MNTQIDVRGHHRGVILVTYRAATVLVAGVVLAIVLMGWRLTQLNGDQVSHANRVRCEAGNDYRKSDLEGWEKLLKLAGPPQTPEQSQLSERFIAFERHKDRQLDCSKL